MTTDILYMNGPWIVSSEQEVFFVEILNTHPDVTLLVLFCYLH